MVDMENLDRKSVVRKIWKHFYLERTIVFLPAITLWTKHK